jgi:hypothetical protein
LVHMFSKFMGSRSQEYFFASSGWWSYISTPKNAQLYIHDTKVEFDYIKNISGADGDEEDKVTELEDQLLPPTLHPRRQREELDSPELQGKPSPLVPAQGLETPGLATLDYYITCTFYYCMLHAMKLSYVVLHMSVFCDISCCM